MKLIDDLMSKNVKLPPDKSSTTYTLLAIFLGAYGVHNFWAGNEDKAKAQLIAGLVGTFLCCGTLTIIPWITALMDISAVKANSQPAA